MLELRPNCEHCDKDLPNTSNEAMICSFECTYCRDCAHGIFKNVCPSCGGNFEKRPIRPYDEIGRHPASTKRLFKPKELKRIVTIIEKFQNIKPNER